MTHSEKNKNRWKEATMTVYHIALSGQKMSTTEIMDRFGLTKNQIQNAILTLNRNGICVRRIGGSANIIDNGKKYKFNGLSEGSITCVTSNKNFLVTAIRRDTNQLNGRIESLSEMLRQGRITFAESVDILKEIEMSFRSLNTHVLNVKQNIARSNKQIKKAMDKLS